MGGDKQPLITAAVPVYMAQRSLARCVDSVLAQTYQNLQIILVDDGSPDDSPQICDAYGAMDRRVLVIHQENGGVSSARNAAIDAAMGEFITFIDSDDCVAPDLVEQLLAASRRFGGGIAICKVTRRQEELSLGLCGEGIVYTPREAMRELTLLPEEGPRFEGWSVSKLFPRSLFSDIRFPVGVSIGEDLAIMYRLFDRAGKIIFVDTAKYFYDNNPWGAVNGDLSQKDLLGILAVWDGFCGFVRERYPELESCVRDRAAIGAVRYYCQMCGGGYTGPDIQDQLIGRVRRELSGLLRGKRPFSCKWNACLTAVCPRLLKAFLAACGQWSRLKRLISRRDAGRQ